MPRIEYGPPGHKGVTQIMGLGQVSEARSLVPQEKPNRTVGVLALAALAGGMVLGSSTAKNIGIGGLLAVVYIQMLKKPALEASAPTSAQGWG